MARFDAVSSRYARDSTVQRTAADVLLALAPIGPRDDVLDVGCGTGALVARVRALTSGRVVGVDPSAGMLEAARRDAPPGVTLERMAAEELTFDGEFDLVLSNSAMQWFHDVPDTAEAYADRLEAAGLRVSLERLEELVARETPDDALRVYGSGAAQAYLNPDCYGAPLPARWAEDVREIVRASFARRAEADGRVALRFRRVFLVARAG